MVNKMQIELEDIPKLLGKYIIEVNDDDHDTFKNQAKGFLLEKRISFVSEICYEKGKYGIVLVGFYYSHSKALSREDFVKKINTCIEGRHYRLLTPKELAIVFEWMREDLISM